MISFKRFSAFKTIVTFVVSPGAISSFPAFKSTVIVSFSRTFTVTVLLTVQPDLFVAVTEYVRLLKAVMVGF